MNSFKNVDSEIVYADNCQVCGQEHLNIELIPVKLGKKYLSRIRVCLGCLSHSDVHNNYKDAVELIQSFIKK